MLEMTNAAASMHLSEEVKLVTELLSGTINSVHYKYGFDIWDPEELHKADIGEELAKPVAFILYDPP